jgi:hypothetical protein
VDLSSHTFNIFCYRIFPKELAQTRAVGKEMESSILLEANIKKVLKKSINIEEVLKRHNLSVINDISGNYADLRFIISEQSKLILSPRY